MTLFVIILFLFRGTRHLIRVNERQFLKTSRVRTNYSMSIIYMASFVYKCMFAGRSANPTNLKRDSQENLHSYHTPSPKDYITASICVWWPTMIFHLFTTKMLICLLLQVALG